MIVLLKVYQYVISPLLGPRCRFWPSCSNYAVEAIQVHGPLKGAWLAIKRIVKCNPIHSGGMDPVPGGPSETLCREDQEFINDKGRKENGSHHQSGDCECASRRH
nr:membrane protein insertion efficiency factor YidD [Halomonas rituensis]